MDETVRLRRLSREELDRFAGTPESGQLSAERETSLTWEQVVRVLRKHAWFLLVFAGALTLVITAAALLMRDVYQPTATLEIDPLGSGIRTLNEIENPHTEADLDYLETQAQIIRSPGIAMRVIRALHLDRNEEIVGKELAGKAQLAQASPSQKKGATEVSDRPSAGGSMQERLDLADATPAEALALRTLQTNIAVNPVHSSRLIDVSYASHDARLAQLVTNTLVAQFIDQNYKNRFVTTMEASDWLSTQLNDLRQKVAKSNQAVADYQKRYGLVDSEERDMPLAQLMSEVSRQLSNSQADRIQAEAYLRMIDLGQPDAVPTVRDDVVYQNLLTRYAEARTQLAQARTIYGDDSTTVKKLEGESNELAAQVEATRARLIERVRTSFAAAQSREKMSIAAADKLREQMGDASSHLVEYRTLKNAAAADAELYNTLQGRLQEAGIYAGLRSGNIRVVDLAPLLQRRTSPHRGLIIIVGAILSCMFALLIAFARETLDNTVRIPDDIRNWLRLPALAVFPTVGRKIHSSRVHMPLPIDASLNGAGGLPKVFWSRSQSAEGEAIRGLRTSLLLATSGSGPQVVLVTSASAGEGKTTVAINLASVLAQHGKTCLVEGDLRRPMIGPALGLQAKAGLTQVLNGGAALDDVLISGTGIPGLSVLSLNELPNNPGDLIASEKMRTTIIGLRQKFEHVVIDSPPVIPFSDALALAPLVDAVILVGRYGRTTRRAILRSAELLSEVQAPLVGVVLNDMDLSSADYHYFNYGYSRNNRYNAYGLATAESAAGAGASATAKMSGSKY